MKNIDERDKRRKKPESIKCFEVSIIGGDMKGKKILIPDIKTTRSSKTILRESLFNTLQFDVVGKNFVEVFAGSGSIGLEADSRGASNVFFIEKQKIVYEILKSNIKKTNIKNATAILGNSFNEFAGVYKNIKRLGVKTYFYFDPPFSIREGMEEIYDDTLNLIKSIEADVCEMVIIEHMTSLDLPDEIGMLSKSKQKKFGKSSLSYYKF